MNLKIFNIKFWKISKLYFIRFDNDCGVIKISSRRCRFLAPILHHRHPAAWIRFPSLERSLDSPSAEAVWLGWIRWGCYKCCFDKKKSLLTKIRNRDINFNKIKSWLISKLIISDFEINGLRCRIKFSIAFWPFVFEKKN